MKSALKKGGDRYQVILTNVRKAFQHRLHSSSPLPCPNLVQLIDLTSKEVRSLGIHLALNTKGDDSRSWLFTFEGEMGAGKTALIQAVAEGLGHERREVQSPTYSFLMILPGPPALYHFDLYRLQKGDDFEILGFGEYLDQAGICCIEWAQKISLSSSLQHRPHLNLALQFGRRKNLRNITISLKAVHELL